MREGKPTLHAVRKSYRVPTWQAKLGPLRRRQVSEEYDAAVRESDPFCRVNEPWRDVRPIEWAVIVRPAITRRCFVAQIDPRFSAVATHTARDLLIRCAPGQPHRVHRHTWANLSLAYQCLFSRRETLIHFGMLRNARFCRCTTSQNQRPGCYPEYQRDRQNSTLHSVTIIRLRSIESIDAAG